MTSSYSGDPTSSDQDRVRYLIGDTGPEFILSDEEIDFEITSNETVLRAALAATRSIIAKLSKSFETRFETIYDKPQEAVHSYRLLATRLEKQINRKEVGFGSPVAGGIRQSDVFRANNDGDRVSPTFDRDQFSYDRHDLWPLT